jgi:hypothetical protein
MKIMAVNRFLIIFAIAMLAFSFMALFLHHHDADHAEHDCPVCRLVQIISGLFVLIIAALLSLPSQVQKFLSVFEPRLSSRLFSPALQERAPPTHSLQ